MRCPFCAEDDSQVKDSRPCEDGMSIRRRRYCVKCGSRFTTFERVQLRELTVIKKNGTRSAFDRDKLVKSFKMAVRKRSIPDEKVDMVINHIIRTLEMTGESEINSSTIGEMIMCELEKLDQVAYVRFASVYKEFGEVKDFGTFIKKLKKS